jgi:hypothetical protein
MKAGDFYRALLHLYPANFRRQFSEEMICVFAQRAGEGFANRKSAFVVFLLGEFSSIVRGAYIMWLANTLRSKPSFSDAVDSTSEPLSIAEVARLRDTAIRNMVAAIACHDFNNARRYSYEEARLKTLLQDMAI